MRLIIHKNFVDSAKARVLDQPVVSLGATPVNVELIDVKGVPTAKRVGDSLVLQDQAGEVVLEGYFKSSNQLIWKNEDGEYAVLTSDSVAPLQVAQLNPFATPMGLKDGQESKSLILTHETLREPWLGAGSEHSSSFPVHNILVGAGLVAVGSWAISKASDSDSDSSSDSSAALRAPSELQISDSGLVVTGSGTSGSLVQVKDAAGNVLGQARASSSETFSITLSLAQAHEQQLFVSATLGDQTSSVVELSGASGANGPVTQVVDVNSAANNVVENAEAGTQVGVVMQASDYEPIEYSLINSSNGLFQIDPVTGVITTTAPLDYEAAATHTLKVRASSEDLSFTEADVQINVGNLNDVTISDLVDIDAAENQIDSTEVVGSLVGITARATDPDGIDSVTYELLDSADGRFQINATNGEILTARDLSEDVGVYEVVVQASVSDSQTQLAFTIEVLAPTELSETPAVVI